MRLARNTPLMNVTSAQSWAGKGTKCASCSQSRLDGAVNDHRQDKTRHLRFWHTARRTFGALSSGIYSSLPSLDASEPASSFVPVRALLAFFSFELEVAMSARAPSGVGSGSSQSSVSQEISLSVLTYAQTAKMKKRGREECKHPYAVASRPCARVPSVPSSQLCRVDPDPASQHKRDRYVIGRLHVHRHARRTTTIRLGILVQTTWLLEPCSAA